MLPSGYTDGMHMGQPGVVKVSIKTTNLLFPVVVMDF